MDGERAEPFHPISCGLYCFFLWILFAVIRCSPTGTELSFCYQEKMINSQANIKMHCLPFRAVWHWGRNSSKIDSSTKQSQSRARPRKRIPQRILAVFHSNHGVVCPWIIQNSLNQWNDFKTTVSGRLNAPYCEFQQIFSLFQTKKDALILLLNAALHLSKHESHRECYVRKDICWYSLLLWYWYKHGVHICIFPAS